MGRHWHSTKLLVVDQSERRQVTACHQEEQAWDHQHGDSALTPPGSSVWGLLIMNNENDRDSEMFWKTEDQGLSLVVRDIRVGDKPSAQHWMFNDNEGKRIVNWWPSTGTLVDCVGNHCLVEMDFEVVLEIAETILNERERNG